MKSVIHALFAAFKSLWHPKILLLMLWPMLMSAALWMVAAFVFWESWVTGLTSLMQAMAPEKWLGDGFFASASHYLVVFALVVMLLSAIYLSALLITAFFVMPPMVSHVAKRYYPDLERKKGGNTADSVANAVVAMAAYLAGWVLTLPLWLLSPLAAVLPVVLMAYLNQRLFRYDALAEHASKEEYAEVVARSSAKLYLLGAIAGLLQFVPVLNLFTPTLMALAFTHLCLAELKQLRMTP